MFDYKISVVIPIYNSEEYLHVSLQSLFDQTMDFKDVEVLLINNGSVDGSEALCLDYAKKYENIKYYSIDDKGVSFARNFGVENANGKYILYLDSDDIITKDTLKKIYNFFEKHYDETDIVTYKLVPYAGGIPGNAHWRYLHLKKTGVYDLEDPENWFISQTTINVCVKNMGKGNNVLFDTSLVIQEDQKYNMEMSLAKRTIGFVAGPEYHYIRHMGSATKLREHPYFIFEATVNRLWGDLFSRFTEVPHYIQALYINDVSWKVNRDIWLPHFYSETDYANALKRVITLTNAIDPLVIVNHPVMRYHVKFYLLKLMDCADRVKLKTDEKIQLLLDGETIHDTDTFTLQAQRMKLIGHKLHADFNMAQVALFFTDEEPKLFLVKDGIRTEVPMQREEFDFFENSGAKAPYYFFRVELDIREAKKFYFEVECFGKVYRASYDFVVNAIFNSRKVVNAVYKDKYCLKFVKRKGLYRVVNKYSPYGLYTQFAKFIWDCIYFLVRTNPKFLINRWSKKLYKKKRPIWFYSDVENVFDNAYMQFMHDVDKDDGIDCYYILHKENLDRVDELFKDVPREKLLISESRKHKLLFLNCDKIITGYSNLGNICPFGSATMRWYYDLLNFEVVYLQHGILHATLVDMYAHNKCQVDRVVVSSGFEVENFTSGVYKYKESELIKSGMPRYDFIKRESEKQNKILFAPSWRQNLVGELINGKREVREDIFLASDFFKATNDFLNSSALAKMLEDNDLILDFKNHPNFACYNHLFKVDNPRINILTDRTNTDEYQLMITDYSSMVFDAVYINCPILYFVPDYEQFRAGVSHGYRSLDLPLEEAFGPFAETAEDLLTNLKKYIENEFQPIEPYKSRMDGFFLHYDDKCRDRLYEEIKNK